MSKVLYGIRNGDNIIGLLWENEKLGKVLVTTGAPIDLNCDIEIRNAQTGKDEKYIDLRDFLLECLPVNESK